MAKCDFCGIDIKQGTGKMYVKDNGKILNFCTNKCEKMLLVYKKKARNEKWTEIAHKEKAAKNSGKDE